MTTPESLTAEAVAILTSDDADLLDRVQRATLLLDAAKAALFQSGCTSLQNGVMAFSSPAAAGFYAAEQYGKTGVRHDVEQIGDGEKWVVNPT